MSWYLDVLKKYAVFEGRSRRSEFWYFFLVNIIISIVLTVIDRAIGTTNGGYGLINGLYSLAVILPYIGVGIRRMHDTNRSGWWILLPIVNLVFWAEDSNPGDNKYGANPKLTPAAA